MLARRTKIVATLGPATDADGVLDRLIAAGMDCARLNCSHGTHDDLRGRAAAVREASERAGRSIGLLFDLQGPKLRLAADVAARAVQRGDSMTFCGPRRATGPHHVAVEFEQFAALVTERSELVIGDGVPRFSVERIEDGEIVARAVSPGQLLPRKGINVTYARPELPAVTDKDAADMVLAAELNADFVALSFVRSAADLEQLRRMLLDAGSAARVIAKIEKIEAYEHLDEIIAVCDGLMVARGDYGVEAGVARVPLMQKDTIKRATQAGKLVITATQMLESMIEHAEPTRAEASDIANAILDGTSAIMLSAETATGAYPIESVQTMDRIARTIEPEMRYRHQMPEAGEEPTVGTAMSNAACDLAEALRASAIIVPTFTGRTASAVARLRPRRPIVGLSHHRTAVQQMALEWGVTPLEMPATRDVEDLWARSVETARNAGAVESGDRVVLTAGTAVNLPGSTNVIKVDIA
jgi:pyruvate kinase